MQETDQQSLDQDSSIYMYAIYLSLLPVLSFLMYDVMMLVKKLEVTDIMTPFYDY